MYYYGYNGGGANYGMPCGGASYAYTNGGGYGGFGAALWIVLFILLVIIIGAGWSFGGSREHERC